MSATFIGLLWYFPTFAAFSVIALYLFDEEKRFDYRRVPDAVWADRAYLLVLVAILLLVKLENVIQNVEVLNRDYTPIIYGIEGNAHIVWLQNSIQSSLFIHSVSIFYVLFFMWLIVFTTVFFVVTDRKKLLRIYTYSLLLNYAVLIPFYLFFDVTVTSMYPEGTAVQPLLYRNDMYRGLVLLVGGFDDCFPSGHISVSTTITLILLFKSNLNRFALVALLTTIFTGFIIVFLGIHWVVDIAGGVVLGSLAFLGAQWPPLTRRLDRLMAWVENSSQGLSR